MLKRSLTVLVTIVLVSLFSFGVFANTQQLSYSLDYSVDGTVVTASLKVNGGIVQAGSFGIGFNADVLEFVSFAYTPANAESVVIRNFSVTTNITDRYIDRWVLNNNGSVVIDATSQPVEIGKFTFNIKSGKTFDSTCLFKAVANDSPKNYENGSYMLTPFATDLSVSHIPADIVLSTTDVTLTFKVNEDDTDAYAVVQGKPGTSFTFPAEPVKEGHTFKYWSATGGKTKLSSILPEENKTVVAMFESNGDSTIPHKYYLECLQFDDTIKAKLYYKGGEVQSGTFGLSYNQALTFTSFTPALPTIKLVGDITSFYENANGVYRNRWIIEDISSGNLSIDGSTEKQLIGTLEFSITQGTVFDKAMISEYTGCAEIPKGHINGKYVVSPYSNDVSITHEAVEFIETSYLGLVEKSEVELNIVTSRDFSTQLSNNYYNDELKTGTDLSSPTVLYDSRARISIYEGDSVSAGQAPMMVFTEDMQDAMLCNLDSGKSYTIKIEKNGYLPHTELIAVDGTAERINFHKNLIAGDIKGSFEDYAGDGVINLDDFIRLTRGFNSDSSEAFKAVTDINESGAVDLEDLNLIKTNFGRKS